MGISILRGDCRDVLRTLPSESVHCVVTSPPYWGLRDYGVAGQLGLEPDFNAYIAEMVAVFREVRRVLRGDGTLWLNMGDSYYSGNRGGYCNDAHRWEASELQKGNRGNAETVRPNRLPQIGLKDKDLVGTPWRVAFALQADGWWLRQDIIWSKPNPMPESVTDRCTKAHEYIFLMSKSARYYYDAEAIRTPFSGETKALSFETMNYKARDRYKKPDGWDTGAGGHGSFHRDGREKGELAPADYVPPNGANKRSVWTIATEAYPDAHFATFPPALIEPCIKAGCPKGGTVLDPFGGAGTTGLVADRLQRNSILIELNPEYAAMASRRIRDDAPLFVEAAE